MLRPYQVEALQSCLNHPEGGVVVSPTGSGKSHIIAALCDHFTHKQVTVVTPRIELMRQNAAKIKTTARCMTINKAYKRQAKGEVLIIDECHLVRQFDGMYKTLMDNYEVVYGFTATPFRMDCGPLVPHVFEKVIFEIEREELIKKGYLTPRNHIHIPIDRLLNVKNPQFNSLPQLSQDVCPQTKKCLDHFVENIEKNSQALLFVCDIQHAKTVQQILKCAKIVHGKLNKTIRDSIIADFKNGKIKYLINCEILTTGFDYPKLENIVILRPTNSYTLYEQICGRGDRVYEKKAHNNIWDYTINSFCFSSSRSRCANNQRHCIFCCEVTDYRISNCQHCGRGLIKGVPPTKECPECAEKNFNVSTYCRSCGAFIKKNVQMIKPIILGWEGKIGGLVLIDEYNRRVTFRTAKKNAVSLMRNFGSGNPIKMNGQYAFFYKYDTYKKLYKLIEIRLDK